MSIETTALFFIIVISSLTEAYVPAIKIYEIRKPKTSDIDDQYYDTNYLKKSSHSNNNVKLEALMSNIIAKLQNFSTRDRGGDYDNDYNEFNDKTRSLPLLIYKKSNRNNLIQNLLNSALRSEYDGVEDRTAPPRHGPIEYDY